MEICNGKDCGTTIKVVGGRYLCQHNNFAALHPYLLDEWDYDKNNKQPDEYTRRSKQKVWWICRNNPDHKWEANLDHRSNNRGCPYCKGNKIDPNMSLNRVYPELSKEWDYGKNKNSPEDYFPRSHIKVWWICKKGHSFNSVISNRVQYYLKGRAGCKYCTNKVADEDSCLMTTHPDLCKEWHPNNILSPRDVTYGSTKEILWLCPKGHSWEASVNNRTSHDSGCPSCYHLPGKVSLEDSLVTTHPDLIKEWDDPRDPKNYSFGSTQRIQWRCEKNHIWESTINNRSCGYGCPKCSKANYSKIQIKWLQEIEEKEKITIHHALSPSGEYCIPSIGKVDGYCEASNTVYEFHGDFWHGNPEMYNPDDLHPVSKVSYGELYKKTLRREDCILSAGYNLVTIWERDYLNGKEPRRRRKIRLGKTKANPK